MSKPHLPPRVPTLPFIWNAFQQRSNPDEMFLGLFRKYGDIVCMPTLGGDTFLVSNPTYIKHFLLDNAVDNYRKNLVTGHRGIVAGEGLPVSEGAHWKRHRRLLQPAFARERLMASVPAIASTVQRVLERHWEPHVRSGEPVDVLREMSRLVISTMGQLVYSEQAPDDISDAARFFMMCAIRPRGGPADMIPGYQALKRRFSSTHMQLVATARKLDAFCWEIVRARMKQSEQADDMLGMMINARDDKGEPLSELEVRDEFFELFYGGHVSTAIGLSWTWFCLAQHAEVRERLEAVVDKGLGGRSPVVEDLPSLQYVGQVFDETLRLHCPAPVLVRHAIKEDRIGDYDVPVGTALLSSAYVMHRHPAYWEQPEQFNPDRFAPEQARARPRFVFLPFGAGQRVCIGSALASLVATVACSMMVQRYRLSLVPEKQVVIMTGGTHYPLNLWMKVEAQRPALPVSRAASA